MEECKERRDGAEGEVWAEGRQWMEECKERRDGAEGEVWAEGRQWMEECKERRDGAEGEVRRYLQDCQNPEPFKAEQKHGGTRYENPNLVHHLVPVQDTSNQITA